MARIVHVGNFSFRTKGGYMHGIATKLSNGFVRNGHQVVNFSDRDVARASSVLGRRKLGARAANRALAKLCQDAKPDLLVLGHADVIEAKTLEGIRAASPALRVVQWNVDPVFEPDNIRRIESKLDQVDATLVSTAGEALAPLRREGRLLGFFPNPVDFSIERGENYLRDDLPYDIFCAIGHPTEPLRQICGRMWDMDDFFRRLMAAVPRAKPLLPGLMGYPTLAGAGYQAALESAAIGLNLSRRGDVLLYSSDRLAQMIGNGQAVAIERATGYDKYFSDDELVFFASLDELHAKLNRLLREPDRRKRIARAGRARYHALFNERIVAQYVLEVGLGRHDPSRYPWPTLVD
jgi:hypothetical protein